MKCLSTFIGLACLDAFTLPANADLLELKVKKPAAERKSDAAKITADKKPNAYKKPKTLKACSKNYHKALRRISGDQLAFVKKAYAAANKIDKSLAGRLYFSAPKTKRSKQDRKILSLASRSARFRGRSPWLLGDNPGWPIRQMVSDFQVYLGQAYHPFLCTGSASYMKFLGQYLPLATKTAKEISDLSNVQKENAIVALNNAWYGMRPAPIPLVAGPRPAPKFSLETDLRPSLAKDEDKTKHNKKLDRQVTNSTISFDNQPEDEDMLSLAKREQVFSLQGIDDVDRVANELIDRAMELKFFEPPSFVEVTGNAALKAAESVESKDTSLAVPKSPFASSPKIAAIMKHNLSSRKHTADFHFKMREALSALEAYGYLELKRQQMADLSAGLEAILLATSNAQAIECTCRR